MSSQESLTLDLKSAFAALEQDDAIRARPLFAAITAANPTNPLGWVGLGKCLLSLREYRNAMVATTSALKSWRKENGLIPDLVRQLRFFYEVDDLVELLKGTEAWKSGDVEFLAEFSATLLSLGETRLARTFVDRAILLAGPTTALLCQRGQIHESVGELEQANADFRHALLRSPSDPNCLFALSRFPRNYEEPGDIDAITESLALHRKNSVAYALLGFALFKHLDRRGDCENAWRILAAANAKMDALVQFDLGKELRLLDRLATAQYPQKESAGDSSAPTPIFIVGLHRTGSTLLDLRLSENADVVSVGESLTFPMQLRWACDTAFPGATHPIVIDKLGELDPGVIRSRYLERISRRARGARFVIEKLPMNFQNVGLIASAIPEARIIHTRRNPMDTCFSNFKEVFRTAKPFVAAHSYNLHNLASYFLGYRRLMSVWKHRFPSQVLDIDYESLVSAPKETIAEAKHFCGIRESGPTPSAAQPQAVVTASSIQVRQPIHDKNVGGWKRYRRHLAPLEQWLADVS